MRRWALLTCLMPGPFVVGFHWVQVHGVSDSTEDAAQQPAPTSGAPDHEVHRAEEAAVEVAATPAHDERAVAAGGRDEPSPDVDLGEAAAEVAAVDSEAVEAGAPAAIDLDTDEGARGAEEPRVAPQAPKPEWPLLALPLRQRGDTRSSRRSVFDAYSCAPEIVEAGAEDVYRIEVVEAGLLEVSLDDQLEPGVDVDVHVLSALDASACLARGHRGASLVVEPGELWVVVDTFSGSGAAEPGPYVLEVRVTAR